MDTHLSEGLVFELFRTETAAGTVASPAIVITLDIIKYRGPHYFTTGKVLSVDAFHLPRVEEAFRTGVIIAVASATHATVQIMPFQQRLIVR